MAGPAGIDTRNANTSHRRGPKTPDAECTDGIIMRRIISADRIETFNAAKSDSATTLSIEAADEAFRLCFSSLLQNGNVSRIKKKKKLDDRRRSESLRCTRHDITNNPTGLGSRAGDERGRPLGNHGRPAGARNDYNGKIVCTRQVPFPALRVLDSRRDSKTRSPLFHVSPSPLITSVIRVSVAGPRTGSSGRACTFGRRGDSRLSLTRLTTPHSNAAQARIGIGDAN